MSWRVLIVHGKEPLALAIRNSLQGEFEEAQVRLASNLEQGLDVLAKEPVDLILCQATPDNALARQLRSHCQQSPRQLATPMVVVRERSTEGLFSDDGEPPLRHQLLAPFSASQMREAVLAAFNPRNRRRHRRLSVPGVKVELRAGRMEMSGEAYNLSHRGMLMAMECPEGGLNLLEDVEVSLIFTQHPGQPQAPDIQACLLRLNIDCYHDGLWPRMLRAAWHFVQMPPQAEHLLARVLAQAEEELEQTEQV